MQHSSTHSSSSWLTPAVMVLGTTSFLNDFSHEAITAILPAFMKDVCTPAVAAIVLALFSASESAANIARLVIAPLSDRYRQRKPFIALGYAITGFGMSLISLATSCWHILILRTFAWLGKGVREAPRDAFLSSLPSTAYGHIFGFERAMDTLGGVAGPLYATLAWTYIPPRLFMAGMAVVTVFTLVLIYTGLHEPPTTPKTSAWSFTTAYTALPRSLYLFSAIVLIASAGVFHRSLLILYAYTELSHHLLFKGISAHIISALLYACLNLARALAEYVLGALSDHASSRLTLLAWTGLFPHLIVCASLIFLPTPSALSLCSLFLLEGMSLGALLPLCKAHMADTTPAPLKATAFAVLSVAKGVGDILSGVLVAVLWWYISSASAFLASLIITAISLILLLGYSRQKTR